MRTIFTLLFLGFGICAYSSDYFPLEIGNNWVWKSFASINETPGEITFEILRDSIAGDTTFYIYHQTCLMNGSDCGSFYDILFVTESDPDAIYVFDGNVATEFFQHSFQDGDSTYIYGEKVKVEYIGDFSVTAGTFTSCYKAGINVFAPDVGLIASCWDDNCEEPYQQELLEYNIVMQPSTDESNFFLDENGITIKCKNCSPGDTGKVNGETYEAVDRSLLVQRINEGANAKSLCTSLVTDMSDLFSDFTTFNGDVSGWDVSNVTNMSNMFKNAYKFKINIGKWDVSSVTDMSNMFYFAFVFNSDVSEWDVGNVTNMSNMFNNAYTFRGTINNWNVSKVMDMSGMFHAASDFRSNLSLWDVSNVTDMSGMFRSAADFDGDLSKWDVSKVTNMSGMFRSAGEFDSDIGDWDVGNVTDMSYMFYFAESFNQDLSNWCVTNIQQRPAAFASRSDLQDDFFPNWGTCKVTSNEKDFSISNSIAIYPNPARDFVNIELSHNQTAEIRLYSVNGEIVLNKKTIGNHRLSTTGIDSGLHFLHVITGDRVYISKLMIVK